MDVPQILQMGPYPQWDQEPLDAAFKMHRYFEADDKDAILQAQTMQLAKQISELELQHPPQASRQLADLAAALTALHRAGGDHATAKRDQAAALIQGQAGQAGATAAMAAI